jgi:hypothetical protein
MSRVKERENVLCAGGTEIRHGRTRLRRPGAGSSFHSIPSTEETRKGKIKIASMRQVGRFSRVRCLKQQTPSKLHLNLEMSRERVFAERQDAPGNCDDSRHPYN